MGRLHLKHPPRAAAQVDQRPLSPAGRRRWRRGVLSPCSPDTHEVSTEEAGGSYQRSVDSCPLGLALSAVGAVLDAILSPGEIVERSTRANTCRGSGARTCDLGFGDRCLRRLAIPIWWTRACQHPPP